MGWRWCPDCQGRVPRLNEPLCDKCGIPTKRAEICEKCRSNPPSYRKMRSWAIFDSPIQNALHTMKYKRNIGLGEMLALQMVDFFHSLHWQVQAVLPVPLGKKRLKERGYNQVGLVARPLAFNAGMEYLPRAVKKTRDTRTQVGLSASQRHKNVKNAYQADPLVVNGKSILLMDDVSTTGSTISACTESLLSAGAKEVYVLTIARALSHHDLNRV